MRSPQAPKPLSAWQKEISTPSCQPDQSQPFRTSRLRRIQTRNRGLFLHDLCVSVPSVLSPGPLAISTSYRPQVPVVAPPVASKLFIINTYANKDRKYRRPRHPNVSDFMSTCTKVAGKPSGISS